MPYRELTGNLFASKAQALVNTVNCVGPMGKGVALEFRRRFPEMFEVYKLKCERRELRPGQILPYRKSTPWVLNFAVKDDWKHPSKMEWVEQCLEKFCEWYPTVGLKSVAFPWMGAMNGRIPLDDIKDITRRYLQPLRDIDVEVYSFDPAAPDPLFETLRKLCVATSMDEFVRRVPIQKKQAARLHPLVKQGEVTSLADVIAKGSLGKASSDKLYGILKKLRSRSDLSKTSTDPPEQLDLL